MIIAFGVVYNAARIAVAERAYELATLRDLLGDGEVVVDCTPKRIAAKNVETYRRRGIRFILQGGEKHQTTGHSFVAECNYATALGRDATRVVSCNTTSVVRTLTALKQAGLLRRAREFSCGVPRIHGRATRAES